MYTATSTGLLLVALLSSEWPSAAEAHEMGLVWSLAEPAGLLDDARRRATVLAARPISSLIACQRVMVAPLREQIEAARERENQCFVELMGGPANAEALAACAAVAPDSSGDSFEPLHGHSCSRSRSPAVAE